MKRYLMLLASFAFLACSQSPEYNLSTETSTEITPLTKTSLFVLGNVQDGGSPHIGCTKSCCKELFNHPDHNRKVVCLGIVDPENNKKYLFEATPDMPSQMKLLSKIANPESNETPDGIFITHAHIGHYTGLMYLGKEAKGAQNVPVYAMPRMKEFLEMNGPWGQLVAYSNISLNEISNQTPVKLTSNLTVVPFTVPHRDEYSETVGYTIIGPNKKALFIPDIDKWDKWEKNIIEEISKVDYAFIDATFYDGEEINNRNISEIPHPFISESMKLFKDLPLKEKQKVYFIHMNHTNPVLNPESKQSKQIKRNGFHVARFYEKLSL